MVELTLFHQCNGGTITVPPLGEGKLTIGTKILFPRFFYVSSDVAKVQHGLATLLYWWVIKASVTLAAHCLTDRPYQSQPRVARVLKRTFFAPFFSRFKNNSLKTQSQPRVHKG
jgi:hypothetical protein